MKQVPYGNPTDTMRHGALSLLTSATWRPGCVHPWHCALSSY